MITFDPQTWPAGDVFYRIAWAIAHAEGADRQGTVPDRLNNPGDISDGIHIFDSQNHDGSSVTKFPDKQTGWQWLHDKLEHIAASGSHIYRPLMTWREISRIWAGDSQDWMNNLCSSYTEPGGRQLGLNVSPDSTFLEFTTKYQENNQ